MEIVLVSVLLIYYMMKNKKITTNFKLGEFLVTSQPYPNVPTLEAINNLDILVREVLQPLRNRVGRIKVTSGYRSSLVNSAIGGAKNSQHLYGEAADIVPLDTDIEIVFSILVNELDYDQAILEYGKGGSKWIHVSYRKGRLRKSTLIAKWDSSGS
jgi:hypothetical protein